MMEIRDIIMGFKNVAVVGISKNEEKHAHKVPRYLKEHGYNIIPINPTADEILGEKCYSTLLDVPEELAQKIEVIDIFRPSNEVGKIVDDAIVLRNRYGAPRAIWMQEGIINTEAAEKARSAGFEVVMDHCMKKEHMRHLHGEDPESD
jgi:predicted CoA-binding protein